MLEIRLRCLFLYTAAEKGINRHPHHTEINVARDGRAQKDGHRRTEIRHLQTEINLGPDNVGMSTQRQTPPHSDGHKHTTIGTV